MGREPLGVDWVVEEKEMSKEEINELRAEVEKLRRKVEWMEKTDMDRREEASP